MSAYDVRNVDAFVRDALALHERFKALPNWEKANVLFRLAEEAHGFVVVLARYYVALARAEEADR